LESQKGEYQMSDWTKYKDHVRATNPEIGKDIDEIEEISAIVGAMIEQRHNLELSQRDLAELCGIPHSSVARIESGKTMPKLSTILKIFNQLGLKLTVQPSRNIAKPM
jgi:ribosome-binding protein aMBF1 (putative translation factor)